MSDITFKLPSFVPFRPKIFDLRGASSGSSKTEILSGLTVALALVPEAVAFAFLAGVPPLVGLYASFIVCLLAAIFGGRPGMPSSLVAIVAVSLGALAINTWAPREADSPAPLSTVRDMLVDSTRAAAIVAAQKAKDAEAIEATTAAPPPSLAAVPKAEVVAPLTEA